MKKEIENEIDRRDFFRRVIKTISVVVPAFVIAKEVKAQEFKEPPPIEIHKESSRVGSSLCLNEKTWNKIKEAGHPCTR